MASRSRLTFDEMALALVLLAIAGVACLSAAQSDTYWLLRAGKEILDTLRVPLTDTYSHTATGLPWPNHEWLWEAGSFGLFSLGGFPLLTAAVASVVLATMILATRLSPGSTRASAVALLLSLPLMASSWALRPQVASQFLLVVLLWLVSREKYVWIPALFLLWANAHGAVAVGGFVLAVVLGFAVTIRLRLPSRAASQRLRWLALATALSVLATLVTPLGFDLWRYVVDAVLGSHDTGVEEWESALQLRPRVLLFWAWCAAYVLMGLTRWRKVHGWSDQVLFVVSLSLIPVAITSVRYIPLFVLSTLPGMIAMTRAGTPRPAEDGDRLTGHSVVALLSLATAICAIAYSWHKPLDMLNWRPVPQEIASSVGHCPGPLYNGYNEGGYLIWAVPEIPVFLDSRLDPYPEPFLAAARALEMDGQYQATFAKYRIKCAALPPESPTSQALVRDGWTVVAQDEDWVVLNAPAA